MTKYSIILITFSLLCQSHRNQKTIDLNTSYYVSQDPAFANLNYLTIRKNPNIYEHSIRGYNTFVIGSWTLNKDTLFLIPQYIITQNNDSNEILKLENYLAFESSDEALIKDWLPINWYIVRANGLYDEWEIITPYTQCCKRKFGNHMQIEHPWYYKINPKSKRLLKNIRKNTKINNTNEDS